MGSRELLRWATRVVWLLPWLVTVALAVGLHASPRPKPEGDGGS